MFIIKVFESGKKNFKLFQIVGNPIHPHPSPPHLFGQCLQLISFWDRMAPIIPLLVIVCILLLETPMLKRLFKLRVKLFVKVRKIQSAHIKRFAFFSSIFYGPSMWVSLKMHT